ncbi:MAG TPA: hypothetical protein VGE06_08940 [Flavisolibacter sp.]
MHKAAALFFSGTSISSSSVTGSKGKNQQAGMEDANLMGQQKSFF